MKHKQHTSTSGNLKHSKLWSLSAVILALLAVISTDSLTSSFASANLIGLDFGSTFMKATLVRPGKKFAIVENTASKRKTETMVTLGKENRLFGADSLLESGKYPLSTFGDVFRLFGQKFDAEEVQRLKKERQLTNEYIANERGLNSWKVEDDVLEGEEIIAMLF